MNVIVIIGDFNLVLDVEVDRRGSAHNHTKAADLLLQYMGNANMIDIWRLNHPQDRTFSWFKSKPKPHFARLDFGLISDSLCTLVNETTYKAGLFTDHSFFEIVFNTNTAARVKRFLEIKY